MSGPSAFALRRAVPLGLAAPLLPIVLATALAASGATAETANGPTAPLGRGTVSTVAELGHDGAPGALAIRFDEAALDGLPDEPNAAGRCFDLDGDGALAAGECEGDYELRLPLPEALAARDDIPFRWVMLNWNPMGHDPMPWKVGHFDVHFYMISEEELDGIGLGTCGYFIDCDAFERAVKPVPAQYVHPDHISVEAAVGGMGNHLIDSKAPELLDPSNAFTHTWIFGAYDGEIAFYEVMLTRAYMMLGQGECRDIKQPAAWQKAGWYPTRYCIRHDPAGRAHEVRLEDFVLREAS